MNTLHTLPKVELHLHLDCSLSYEVVRRINPTITLAHYQNNFVGPAKFKDLADFLTRAVNGFQLMQTKEQLQWVVEDLFQQLAADNVLYAEIRFAPLLHTAKGLTPYEVVQTVEAATAAAIATTGIEARLILCTLRHYNEAQSMQTVQLVEQFKGTTVAGFDIAGDEAGHPVTAHINAFAYAKTKNIPCTAHAGEAKGADSVWETLQHFAPSRIGHGTRSFEDAGLVAHLKQQHIHLELCPTCNVQINIYDTYQQHPIDALYKAGVSLNVNTDTRTITNISLNKEYEKLQQHFGWTTHDFYQCNLNALNAAFIDDVLRVQLIEKLQEGYAGIIG